MAFLITAEETPSTIRTFPICDIRTKRFFPEWKNYHVAIFFSDITNRDAEYITDYVSMYLKKDEVI